MRVGDYELERKLAEGAFGTTFLARHTESGDVVALKRLSLKGLPDWKPLERFEREAKVLRSLDHRGVVRFVDAFQHDDDFYIAAQWVEGDTLGEKIERGDRWSESGATDLLTQLLETLVYLHGLSPRVVHRDIKPANVIVRPSGAAVLVDFGAVTDAAARRADGGVTVAGTAGYMPPEQAMGNAEPRSDLYALGATMLHALSHTHPADLPRAGLQLKIPGDVAVSAHLRYVLGRMVEPDPGARFASAADTLAALRNTGSGVEEGAIAARRKAELEAASAAIETRPSASRPLPAALGDVVARRARDPDPATHVLKTYALPAVGILLGLLLMRLGALLGGVAFLIGFSLLPSVLARRRRHAAAQRYLHGVAAKGHVLAIEPDDLGGSRITYRFRHKGGAFDGTLRSADADVLSATSAGSVVHVFFDEGDPTQHLALLPAELATRRE